MSYPFLSDEWIQAARDIRHKYADSVPPVTTASHRPHAIRRAALPMACVEAAQAVQIVSVGP